MLRNADEIMAKATGVTVMPSTKPMPVRLAIFNGLFCKPNSCLSQRLIMPMRGCSKKIQPMALRKVGINTPMLSSATANDLYGKSVRSISQANMKPSDAETNTAVSAMPRVFHITL